MQTIQLTRAEFDALPEYPEGPNGLPGIIPNGYRWKQEAFLVLAKNGGQRRAWVLRERLADGSYPDWRIINTD